MTEVCAFAQSEGYDVFNPIGKYLEKGDEESLSAWFSDNLEISILAPGNISSKNQAKQILKSFFEKHKPREFKVTHKAEEGKMKYAVGTLSAGGELYVVAVFLHYDGKAYKIQQMKIDRFE